MNVFIAIDTDEGLESQIASRFGRAEYFMIFETDNNTILSTQANAFKDDAQGVGTRVAAMVVENNCKAAIGAQPGPKAADILAKSGVKMLVNDSGTVKQAIEHFRQEFLV